MAKIHAELRKRGINCVKYHGQLDEETKRISFEKWMNGEKKAIVANSSFGMGINKTDVRYIIHVRLPTSIEEYYQQCGRAGRDGLPSICKLFYNYADKIALYKLFGQQQLDALQQRQAVNDLIVLVENPVQCRHKLTMNYFGENRDEFRCITNCDSCINQGFYITDGTNDALKVVQAIVELGNNKCSCNLLKLILQGSRRKEVLSNNFDCLTNFGSLQKKFVPVNLLDKFLHLLIHQDILGEDTNSLHSSLKVGITLGSKAHSLLALNTTCIKYIKY